MKVEICATSCSGVGVLEEFPQLKHYNPKLQGKTLYIKVQDLSTLFQLKKDVGCELVITNGRTEEFAIEIYDNYRE